MGIQGAPNGGEQLKNPSLSNQKNPLPSLQPIIPKPTTTKIPEIRDVHRPCSRECDCASGMIQGNPKRGWVSSWGISKNRPTWERIRRGSGTGGGAERAGGDGFAQGQDGMRDSASGDCRSGEEGTGSVSCCVEVRRRATRRPRRRRRQMCLAVWFYSLSVHCVLCCSSSRRSADPCPRRVWQGMAGYVRVCPGVLMSMCGWQW